MLDPRRLCAAAATATATLGAVGLAVAVAGSEPFRYVSESGVAGAPHAALYRISMLLLAASLALLVIPARQTGRLGSFFHRGPLADLVAALPAGLVAWALAAAAPLAGLASAVTCSPGCPLPPYETSTPRDLTHAAGAIGALLLCALVMLLYAIQPDPGSLRRAGRFGVLAAFPPMVLSAIGILLLGRGLFTGIAERAALVAVSAWLVLTAALHLRTKP
jgi:hypothetical protein